jgi:DNA replication factor Cdt1 C-terminal domain
MQRTTRQRTIRAFTTQTKPFDSDSSLQSRKRKLILADDDDDSDVPQLPRLLLAKKRKTVGIVTPPRTPTPPNVLHNNNNNNTTSLEDLTKLNAAFLSSMSLQYAHNGSSSSLDLRTLLPSVTKSWSKRQVGLDDIQALLSIYNDGLYRLVNFGDGKVCIEKSPVSMSKQQPRKRQVTGSMVGGVPLDEADLKQQFAIKLEQAWNDWLKARSHQVNVDYVSAFLQYMANKHSMEESSTIRKIAPLRSRGQQRLEEVLGPLMKKIHISDDVEPSQETANKRFKRDTNSTNGPKRPQISRTVSTISISTQTTIECPKPESAASRSASLLSRIQAKEAFLASQPAGPSKEERERLAALQRAQEVFDILNLLAVSKGGIKVTFPLPSLVNNMQASIRSPMSKDEIVRCVTVLQKEIAPGHISLVTYGSIIGVVVDRLRKPATAVVADRLRERGA